MGSRNGRTGNQTLAAWRGIVASDLDGTPAPHLLPPDLHPVLSGFHEEDLIGEGVGLGAVMRGEYNSCTVLRAAAKLSEEAVAQRGVKVGEGLVEQQERRVRRDGASDSESLLLAAGERRGKGVALCPHSAGFQDAAHAVVALLPRQPGAPEHEIDVAPDAHVWPQRQVLKDHPDGSRPGRGGPPHSVDALAVNPHGTALRLFEARDESKRRCFAAPARSKQAERLARLRGKG